MENIYSSSIINNDINQIYATRHWSEQLINDETVFLYVLSPIGNIIYCSNNSSCKRITSYDTTDLIGQSISQFLHPDEHIPFFQSLKQIFDIPHRMTKLQFRWKIKHSPGYYLLLQSLGYSKIDNDTLNSHSSNSTHSPPTSIDGKYSAFFTITIQNHIQQQYPTFDPTTYDFLMKLKMENQLLQQRIIQLTNSTISNNNDPTLNNNNNINIIHPNHNNNNHFIHFYNQHHQITTGSNLNNNNNNNNIDMDYHPLNTSSPESSIISITNNPFPIIEYDSTHPPSSSPITTTTTIPYNTSSIDKLNNNRLHVSPPSSSPSSSSSWVSTNWQQPQTTSDPTILLNFTKNESIKKDTLIKKEINKEEKKRKQKKVYTTSENYQCMDCGSRNSPEWRKGPLGPKTLCNACGLRWAKKNKKQVM